MTLTRPVGMKRLATCFQTAYAMVAFSGALLMQASAPLTTVQAQVRNNDAMEHRWEMKSQQVDRHLESTDARIQELSDRVATMQGMGTGAFAVLTALQILGIIASAKAPK